ncbi:hypothetical protein AWB75_06737 [Caballeronia catudaia]|uniref:DUF1269 domain-containing protein n=1 Tax=Caballeronia catudaia TaxID=1777136 RepID=A0A158DJA6_9BURK|nr:hypothetical protein [Caballeronia catudaia]SAK93887.1 hypothetical protein AWB75_06737 [Caballeronia catudaia]
MSDNNVVLLVWDEPSKTYQAYSELKSEASIVALAVISRNDDGTFSIRDGQDKQLGLGSLGGVALGTLIGVLGGPLGMLLGFIGGWLVSSGWDIGRNAEVEGAMTNFSHFIPTGKTGLIAEATETTPDLLNGYAERTAAVLWREPVDKVRISGKSNARFGEVEQARREVLRSA